MLTCPNMAGLKACNLFPVVVIMFLFFLLSPLPPPSLTVPSIQAVFPVFLMVSVCDTLTLQQVSNNESRGSD